MTLCGGWEERETAHAAELMHDWSRAEVEHEWTLARAGNSLLGSMLMLTLDVSRRDAEHAVAHAAEWLINTWRSHDNHDIG